MSDLKKINRLGEVTSSWLKDTVNNVTIKKIHYDNPKYELEKIISGDTSDILSISTEVDSLGFWYLINYEDKVINDGIYTLDNLGVSAKYFMSRILFREGAVKFGKEHVLLKTEAAFTFSLLFILGWYEEANRIGGRLLSGIDSKLLDLRINDRHSAGKLFKHFWFLLNLYTKTFKKPSIDTSLYSYPDDMSPYQKILNNWDVKDLSKVNLYVSEMAEYHIAQAKTPAHHEVFEFDSNTVKLFPYEILAYLRMREWVGLKNPESFDHPLMQYPLAKMPDKPVVIPETPLLDQVIEIFKREFPGSFS